MRCVATELTRVIMLTSLSVSGRRYKPEMETSQFDRRWYLDFLRRRPQTAAGRHRDRSARPYYRRRDPSYRDLSSTTEVSSSSRPPVTYWSNVWAKRSKVAGVSLRQNIHKYYGENWCMLSHVFLHNSYNKKPIWMIISGQIHLWCWLLTFWPPKLIVSCPRRMDHLCQLASKSVYSFAKYHVHEFANGRTDEPTDRSRA